MKKRILFLILINISLLVFFAISASAAETPKFGLVERIDIDSATEGVQEINIANHLKTVIIEGDNPSANARVILTCSCEAGSHTYPTYYITQKDSGDYIGFNFADINTYNPCKVTYSSVNVLAIEIPNGIKAMTNLLKGNTTVKLIDMSTAETMTCVETGVGYNAVANCTSLIEVRIPASMTEIKGYSFFGCTALERFIIPEDSNLNYIGAFSFSSCTSLTAFYLPSKLVTIGNNGGTGQGAFNECTNLYFVNEPVTPTYTPAKPSIYYFPSTLKTLYGEELKNCKNLNDTFVFPEGFTAVSNRWVFSGSTFTNAVFLGDMTEVGAQYWGCSRLFFANKNDLAMANIATFTNPSDAKVYFCNAAGNTTHLVKPEATVKQDPTCISAGYEQTYCFCKAPIAKTDKEATGIHTFVTNDCTVSVRCTGDENCEAMSPANEKHALVHTLAYANGFDKAGVYNYYCENAGCTMADTAVRDAEKTPIITFKGYSVPEAASYLGINAGYHIDTTLLSMYETLNEKKVTIGLLMVNAEDVADVSDILNAEGELVANVRGFSVTMTSNSYSDISIEIKNFQLGEEKNGNYYKLSLVSALFVKVDDKIDYLQDAIGDETEGNRVTTTSGVVFDTITASRVYASKNITPQ